MSTQVGAEQIQQLKTALAGSQASSLLTVLVDSKDRVRSQKDIPRCILRHEAQLSSIEQQLQEKATAGQQPSAQILPY